MSKRDFENVYAKVPVRQKELLREFRAHHLHRELIVDGIVWRYISCGRGSTTLFFLPGAFVGTDLWFHAISALEDEHHIIALECSYDTFAAAHVSAAVLEILKVEKLERVTLIGISYGGGLAQYFLQSYPQKVEHLVLSHCTPVSARVAQVSKKALRILNVLPGPLIRMMLAARVRFRKYSSSGGWAEFVKAYFREIVPAVDKETLMRFFQAGVETSLAFDFKPEGLRSWSGEILLLSSKDDELTFPRLDELQDRYPRAKTHIFEDGGHHTILLFPEMYCAVLTRFLNEVS